MNEKSVGAASADGAEASSSKTRRVALIGVMLVLALAASYAERVAPSPIPAVPGIKLGLANAVILIVLYLTNVRTALLLNVMRVVLSGLLFSGVWGAAYGLSGALLSFAVMATLQGTRRFGVVGVSIAGGVAHNVGQLLLAAWLVKTPGLAAYLPMLILSGMVAGTLVGVVAGTCVRRLWSMRKSNKGAF